MTEPLYADPIVAEIHKIREQLIDDCNGDVAEFRRRLQQRQAESGRRIVRGPVPKRPGPSTESQPTAQSK